MSTFEELEQAVVDALVAKGLSGIPDINIDVGVPVDTVIRPWVRALISDIKFKKLTVNKFKAQVILSVGLEVGNLKSDKDRRKAAYPVVRGIILFLSNNALGLDIDPLVPLRAADTTPYDIETNVGTLRYQIDFSTGMQVTIPETDAGDLLKLSVDYFLKPGDAVADASDEVDLTGVD
jgi:hypothetical protein